MHVIIVFLIYVFLKDIVLNIYICWYLNIGILPLNSIPEHHSVLCGSDFSSRAIITWDGVAGTGESV